MNKKPVTKSRGHKVHYTYDVLQRPVSEIVQKGQDEFLAVKNVYGDSDVLNNKGRIHQVYDQSGLTEFSSYDFKGNPLEQKKKFCQSYDAPINWAAVSAPEFQKKYNSNEDEVFTTSWSYNALNQPLLITLPDGSSQQNTYNKAGLLETVSSNGQAYVSNINHNEKGQRSDIHYGNGCKTRYEYDKNTFRLIRLYTNRNDNNNDENVLQDIHYTYDPVGNIVEIVDNAHQKKYFDNAVIEPKGQYEYDALYRLIKATGRELCSLQLPTHSDFANNIPVPNMGNNAMQNYTQQFTYDELGNIIQMKSVGQWTRDYFYDILHNNYLTGHTPRAIDYTYDEHGNMLKMPHLQSMHYDYKDQLNKVVLDASENTASYIYDANGQRVRKVIEKTGGIKEERYYLGNYEVYRKFVGITLETERTTVAVADDKRKIATIDKLTVDKRSLINLPVAVIRYQYDNHLGSASLELDATAQIISYEEYHPFGTTSYRSGKSETEVSQKRYKYVGKERDEETGLYYYGARYYAAWIGRFVSVDPLAHERTWVNPYNYVQNNPINRTDPTGALDKVPDWFESDSGNVIWDSRTSNNITVNGETFNNIGKTYAVLVEDGSYINFFQNKRISISNSKLDIEQLIEKNDAFYNKLMKTAPTIEMQREIFMTRLNINRSDASTKVLIGTFAVPATIIGGEFMLSSGIISTEFWGGKAIINAGTQAIMNKGNVDVFDVAIDAVMTPGASALFGASVDINVGRRINMNWIGNGKTFEQFGVDVGTGYFFGELNSKAFKSLSPYLQNNTEKAIFNTVTSIPLSVLGGGLNKVIKKKQHE